MRILFVATASLAWSFRNCGAFLVPSQLPTTTTTTTTTSSYYSTVHSNDRTSKSGTAQQVFALKAVGTTEGAASASIDIPILYESDRILIVNKPPGIAHHNDIAAEDDDTAGEEAAASDVCTSTGTASLGIVNRLRQQRHGERLWGVHRLDRVTSGILILAKDVETAQALTKCFADGTIQKVYMGVSAKRPIKKKQGWVQGGMVRSRDKSWKLTRNSKNESNSSDKTNFAKTRFFTAPIQYNQQKFTLVLFRPYTGKTHQLRVAAKSMGLPLWGDPIYKDGSSSSPTASASQGTIPPKRTHLHASGILIPPILDHSEKIAVWCPPPFGDVVEGNMTSPITALIQKHCDVPEIVQAMERLQR